MFYKFKKTLFVSSHHYLLKSFKFNIEQNQLVDLTIGSPTCKLPKMIQKYRSNIVIITDLFATDKQLHLSERKWLLGHMVKSIHNISESIIAAIFSPVVIDNFRKVIDNKLKKSKIITTNKQNRER